LEQNNNNKFYEGYAALTEQLPKIQTVIEAEHAIAMDLASINELVKEKLALDTLESSRLDKLVDIYNQINGTLKAENALLEALNSDTEKSEIEQKLAVLLNALSVNTMDKERGAQLLNSLATLEKKAYTILDTLSEEDILLDFDSCNSALRETALADVRAAVIDSLETYYLKQLEEVSNDLDSIVNSENKAKLIAVLDNLQAKITSSERAELAVKVNELRNLAETGINSIVNQMVEAAVDPNYTKLLSLLSELRQVISEDRAKVLIAEIEKAVNEDNYSQLADLLAPVFESGSFSSEWLEDLTELDLVSQIDDLYNIVQEYLIEAHSEENIPAEDPDAELDLTLENTRNPEIVQAVEELKEAISDRYLVQLELVLTDMKAALDVITNPELAFSDTLANINTGEEEQIGLIIKKIKSFIEQHNNYLKDGLAVFKSFTNWEDNTCKDFIKEAIIKVWPDYVASRLASSLKTIRELFTKASKEKISSFDAYLERLKLLFTKETETMRLIANSDSFKELFEDLRAYVGIKEQASSNTDLIAAISTLLPDIKELTDVDTINSHNNIYIKTLILDWQQAGTLSEKVQLQESIKKALAESISIDEQMFKVVANLLCPNITKLLTDVPTTDGFYTKLRNEIASLKKRILEKDLTGLHIVDDSHYLGLLALPVEEFKMKLDSFNIVVGSLLPTEIVDSILELSNLKRISEIISADMTVLSKYQLETMSSIDLRNIIVTNTDIEAIFEKLCYDISALEQKGVIEYGYEKAFKTLKIEEQLLADIKQMDAYNHFYYSLPVEDYMAINLNENDKRFCTLMNPSLNYDINNINNNFVISKLDIDYLDSGIKIARSSMLN
jgi:hypothetical protein